VAERREHRDRVLLAVYDITRGDPFNGVSLTDVAAATDLSAQEVEAARQWLLGHRLAGSASAAGDIVLTAGGVDRAEELLEREEAESPGPESAVVTIEERRVLERFVWDVRHAQLATIEAQMRSPRPRREVIRWALAGLKYTAPGVVVGVLANTAFAGLAALLTG
jgi:hypothetical protein